MTFEGTQKKSVKEIRDAVKKETYDFIVGIFNDQGFNFNSVNSVRAFLKKIREGNSFKEYTDSYILEKLSIIAEELKSKIEDETHGLDRVILSKFAGSINLIKERL